MDDIKIVDNLLPQGYADAIETDLMRTRFPWYYINDVTDDRYGNNSGFVHLAYDYGAEPSEYFTFIKPLVYHIEQAHGKRIKQLYRIRIGMILKRSDDNGTCNTPHLDFLYNHYTACYYATDSDGDTQIFDKFLTDVPGETIDEKMLNQYAKSEKFNLVKSVAPVKNRLCIFHGHRFHASTNPREHDRRIVITVNYETQD